jgi:arabinogalactan endo-1,4-beta-galactosidase
MKTPAALLTLLLLPAFCHAEDPAFYLGADLSMLQFIEDHGVQYKDAGQEKDALLIFKNHGFNTIRLRLFVNPDGTRGQVNTLPYTVGLAQRVKKNGFHFLLDFHYSDGWADPGKQTMPAAWKNLSHAELVQCLHDYTREALDEFRKAGCPPDMVQIGNEITNGMCWPEGGPLKDEKWDSFIDLLHAGTRAVREASGSNRIKIILHIDHGWNNKVSRWFFDHVRSQNVDFDIIGLSFYPFENASLAGLQENLADLARNCGKDIMVTETACYWRGDKPAEPGQPYTPETQKIFLEKLLRTVAATPGGRGKGLFYWAPEWIMGVKWSDNKKASGLESRALFDETGNALPGMDAFRPMQK